MDFTTMMNSVLTTNAFFLTLLLLILKMPKVVGETEQDIFGSKRNLYSNAAQIAKTCLICNVASARVQYGVNQATGPNIQFLSCVTESTQDPSGLSNQVYRLDQLPESFLRRYRKQLDSGKARICIHQGRTNRRTGRVVIPNNSTLFLLPPVNHTNHRRLYPMSGTRKVLAVFVTSTAGEDPGITASQVEGAVFGTGPDAVGVNLVSQYGACSQSKLNLVPATGNNIVNGVLQVKYNGQVAGGDITGKLQSDISTLVLQSTGAKQLSQAADHILFCIPNGSVIPANNSRWVAFSYLNSVVSFYQKGWCLRVTALMHEVGHQFGYLYSGTEKNQYGDQSCSMGSSYNLIGKPQECFNSHKNWLSGWFEDRKISINLMTSGAWVGNLVTHVDYPLAYKVPTGVVLINVGDLYMQLNSAKKHNIGVASNANLVTIVQSNATSSWSVFRAGLSSGQTYLQSNFTGTGIGLRVQVCSITFGVIDYAKVSVYLDNGVQSSLCPAPATKTPSRRPTLSPTKRTRQPTVSISPTISNWPPPLVEPSALPTLPPSRRPSLWPTLRPSPRPSFYPSRLPTSKPTVIPTQLPSQLPTHLPTQPPTHRPTYVPTLSPSSVPIKIPTSRPSPPPTLPPTSLPIFRATASPSSDLDIRRFTPPPTRLPTFRPTSPSAFLPTKQPSSPASLPTLRPTYRGSALPTSGKPHRPTVRKSRLPTKQPVTTSVPTWSPTKSSPVSLPTKRPTSRPTNTPTLRPNKLTSVPSVLTGIPTLIFASEEPISSPNIG